MILDELQGWILNNLTCVGLGDTCQVSRIRTKTVFVDVKRNSENSNYKKFRKEFKMI